MNWVSSNIRTTGLLTDFYELTMAAGYWKSGMVDREAVFHLFFRKHPFQGGYTIAAGLADAVACLRQLRFDESDLAYLRSLKSAAGRPLFEPAFLDYLPTLKLACDVDAVREGTVVFPHEPLVRVRGPILQAQLIETMLLQTINFQSLIATKAARICQAAAGDPVIEFGLRRSQGADGGLAASRAAYIGGCSGTSNVIAGRELGIPVKGTHAHSWVMAFPSEQESFAAFARAMPENCILLVDTYDSLDGVRQAVEVGKQLRAQGHALAGIRLDSGDLAYLSIAARKILDEAGFPDVAIIGSNDLDEHIITSLKQQGARINVWGVGTRLVTAFDEPALGGVYKLTAIRGADGKWEAKLKLSEQTAKITTPGILQVRRFRSGSEFIGDAVYDTQRPIPDAFTIIDPLDGVRRKHFSSGIKSEDLLLPVLRKGALIKSLPDVHTIQSRVREQISGFHSGIKRLVHPHQYPVGLEAGLHDFKTRLVLKLRKEE